MLGVLRSQHQHRGYMLLAVGRNSRAKELQAETKGTSGGADAEVLI